MTTHQDNVDRLRNELDAGDAPPPLKPPSTLLMGPVGSGKTTALATYLEAGLKLVVIFTEPGGQDVVLDTIADHKLPLDNFYYRYVPFASTTWEALSDLITKVGTMSYKGIAGLPAVSKTEFRQMFDLHEALSNFTCQRSGKNLGPIDDLDDTYAFGLDSLSGFNQMNRDLVVGARPCMAQGEWGIGMNVQMRIINKLTSDLKCFFCLTAHVHKLYVEAESRIMFTPVFLVRSLADEGPRMFSDVILTKRNGTNFTWSVMEENSDTKFRNVEPSSTLAPTFVQIVDSYKKRKALVEASS